MCLSGFVVSGPLMCMLIMPMDWTWRIIGVDFNPWRLTLVCTSLMNLFTGIVFAILPESPKFLLVMNRKQEALQVLRRIYVFNTGQSEENYPVKSIVAGAMGKSLVSTNGFYDFMRLLWSQTKPVFLHPLLTNTWKICYTEFAIFAVVFGTSTW